MSTLSFPTRAALIAATIPAEVLHVFVSGVGEYRKDNSSANPAATSNSGGTKWIPSGRATVDHFGAVGDGTTDDRAAILAADNYVASIGGGDLQFSPKTYCIGAVMVKASRVVWVGPMTIKLLPTITNSSTPIIQTSVTAGLGVRTAVGVGFRNMKFDGNRAAMTHWTTNRVGIQLGKTIGAVVEWCEFVDFKGIMIAEQGCFNTKIAHNIFRNCARTDIEAPVVLTNTWQPDITPSILSHVVDNIFEDNQFSAIYMNGNEGQVFSRNWCKNNGESTVFSMLNPKSLTITDNHIEGTTQYFSAAQGVELQDVESVTITGNTFKNIARMGLSMMNVKNGKVSGNHFIDCALDVDKSGTDEHQSAAIVLATVNGKTTSNVSIAGNTFTATSAGQKYCFSGNQSGATAQFFNLTITNNIMLGGYASGGYPVRWFGAARPGSNVLYADNIDGIKGTPVKGFWARNSRILLDASSGGHLFTVCTTEGWANGFTWSSGTSYVAESHVNVTGVGVFRCAVVGPGTSTVQPSVGFGYETTADGYTWQRMGSAPVFKTAGAISA